MTLTATFLSNVQISIWDCWRVLDEKDIIDDEKDHREVREKPWMDQYILLPELLQKYITLG